MLSGSINAANRGQHQWPCWLQVHLPQADSSGSCTEGCDMESWREQVLLHSLLLL